MAQPAAAVPPPPQVTGLVRALAGGRPKPVYLFIGEPFATAAAARALIDALVPQSQRAFNLEVYDGRTTPIAIVIDSLRMPGFLTGTKVVWVRESTLLLSGEKRADMTKALFDAWQERREQEAAEKLLTLVALAGWSQDQLVQTHWAKAAKTRVREVFGSELEAEELAQLDSIQAACIARDLSVSAYRDDSGALLEFLDAGMPPNTVLVLTAATADARKRLYKRLSEIGALLDVSSARERSGALSRDSVDDLVRSVVQAFGKQLAGAAREVIARRAGSDPAMVAAELEKLCLFVGDRPAITEEDARQVFRDMAESWIFDFTGALTGRQLERALPLLRGLLGQGEPPLRLLAMIVREVRLLLVARECLEVTLRRAWRPDMQFNTFQSRVLPQVDAESQEAFGKAHPFVLYRRFQEAARIDSRTLRHALLKLSELDMRLKSSRSDAGILLEAFLIDWCRRAGSGARGAAGSGSQRRV
jgi:DNA polymerase III subunit delta